MTDASRITYAGNDHSKWDEGANPGDVDDGINQLARRMTWIVTGIKTAAYTASDRELVRVDPS